MYILICQILRIHIYVYICDYVYYYYGTHTCIHVPEYMRCSTVNM